MAFDRKAWNKRYNKYYRENFPEKVNAAQKRNRIQRKLAILNFYGGHCAACGETDTACLSIDHINDDGAEDRRRCKTQTGSKDLYWELYKQIRAGQGRTDLQVLCMNCQWRKRSYGPDWSTWPWT